MREKERERERRKSKMAVQNDPGQIRMPHLAICHLFNIYSHGMRYHFSLSLSFKKTIVGLVDMRIQWGLARCCKHTQDDTIPNEQTSDADATMRCNANGFKNASFSLSPLIIFVSPPSNQDARVEGIEERKRKEWDGWDMDMGRTCMGTWMDGGVVEGKTEGGPFYT